MFCAITFLRLCSKLIINASGMNFLKNDTYISSVLSYTQQGFLIVFEPMHLHLQNLRIDFNMIIILIYYHLKP